MSIIDTSLYFVHRIIACSLDTCSPGHLGIFDQKLTVRAFVDDVTIFLSSDRDVFKAREILDFFLSIEKDMDGQKENESLCLWKWKDRLQWIMPGVIQNIAPVK